MLMRELTAYRWLASNKILLRHSGVQGDITGVGTEVPPSRGGTGVDLVGDVADWRLTTHILFLETSQQTT